MELWCFDVVMPFIEAVSSNNKAFSFAKCAVERYLFLFSIKDEAYAYNLLFINSKISLDKLTENLKKRNQY
jgi:hypothetical protein